MAPEQDDQFDDLDDFDAFDEAGDDLSPLPASGGTGDSGGDDDWNEYDDEALAGDEAPEAAPARAAKKKSGLFNILLIGGVVLAGGAFILMQLGGGAPSPAPQTAPADMAVAQGPAPVPRTPDAAFPADSPPVAPMAAPEEVSNPALPPMPATIERADETGVLSAPTPTPAPAPPVAAAPVPTPEQAIAAGAEAGAIRMPRADDVLLKSSAPPVEAAMVAEATPAPAPTTPALDAKIDQMLARMDSLEKEFDALRQVQAAEKSSPAPDLMAEIAGIRQSVTALEARVDTLAAAASAARTEKPARAPVKVEPAPPAEKPPIISPKILGEGVETAPPAAPSAKPAAEPAVRWVLKGAQPGRAMVARAGESDIQNVAVGDTLPGLGRITAIVYQDGKWVVEGTRGRISQ